MPLSPDLRENLAGDESVLWLDLRNQGSALAREKIFALYCPFARSIGRRLYNERSHGDIDIQDIYQLAYTGLLEAIDRFDPAHGAPFRPFAAHRVAGSIRDGIPRMSETREQMSWLHRLRRQRIQSINESQSASTEAIEKLTDLVVGLAIGYMLEGTGILIQDESIQGEMHGGGQTAYDSLAWKDVVSQLKGELLALPDRERVILQKHYVEDMGFENISALLGISKGRVSQLHRAALILLRRRMSERGHNRIGSIVG